MIAVGSDDTASGTSADKVQVYEYIEPLRRWLKVESLPSITSPVHDIAFAPNIGRSYSVLAVATKDLRIITLKPAEDTAEVVRVGDEQHPTSRYDVSGGEA